MATLQKKFETASVCNFTIAGILFNAVIFGFVTLKFVMIKSGSFADLYFEKVQSELALFKVG